MRITTQAGCLVAPFPSHMPQRKVKFNPSIHLSNCAFRTGRGGTLPDPSRQAARALEACDLIKIIVLMQTHKCQGDREGRVQLLCSAQPRRLGARGLRGHGQTAQPFGSFPAYSGLWHFPQKLFFFFFLKHTSFYFKYPGEKKPSPLFVSLAVPVTRTLSQDAATGLSSSLENAGPNTSPNGNVLFFHMSDSGLPRRH